MNKKRIAREKKISFLPSLLVIDPLLPNFKQITRCTTKRLEKEKRKKNEIDGKSEFSLFIYFTSISKL